MQYRMTTLRSKFNLDRVRDFYRKVKTNSGFLFIG